MTNQNEDYLLREWQIAVKKCSEDLNRGERELMLAFKGPPDVIADMKRMQVDCSSRTAVVERVSPFFKIVKTLTSSLLAVVPGMSDLELVDGGAYMVLRRGLPSQEATTQLLRMLEAMTKRMSDFEVHRSNAKKSDIDTWRGDLTKIFIAMIRVWAVSVRILRRASSNHERLQQTWNEVERAMTRAINDMEEATEHLQKMTDNTGQEHVIRAAESSNDVASMVDFEEVSEAIFPVWAAAELGEPNFKGRGAELKDMQEYLQGDVRPSGQAIVVISGLGGVGKTALAAEYASTCRQDGQYDVVLWIEAETEASMRKSFTTAAKHLLLPKRSNDDTENHIHVKQWLNKTKKKWLIVFDNVDQPELLAFYRPHGTGSMVITTRIPQVARSLRAKVIALQKFSKKESQELFNLFRQNGTTKDAADKDVEDAEDLDFVLRELDGLALGIKQVGNYIRDSQWSIKKFREKYRSMTKTVLSDGNATQHTLATAWDVQFKDLQEWKKDGHTLLSVLCLLNADAIPSDILFAEMDTMSSGVYQVLEDDEQIESALILLSRAGLIERKQDTLSIHRLLQSAFKLSRFGLEKSESLQSAIDVTSQLLNNKFPKHAGAKSLYDEWQQCSLYLQHVISLTDQFVQSSRRVRRPQSSMALDELLKNCCWYLYESGQYHQGLRLLKIAMEINLDHHGSEYATLCQAAAGINAELNNLPACVYANEQCLAIRKNLLGNDHQETANAYDNTGHVLTMVGRFDDGIESFNVAQRIRSRKASEASLYLAKTEMMIGRTYLLKSDLSTARRHLDEAESRFRLLGTESCLLYSFLFIDRGNLELKQGNIEGALQRFNQAHELASGVSKTHFTVSVPLYKLGTVHTLQGDYTEARDCLSKALILAKHHQIAGHEARIYRAQWQLFMADPAATDTERKSIPVLQQKAEEIKKDIEKQNAGLWVGPKLLGEEAEYDALVCSYFR